MRPTSRSAKRYALMRAGAGIAKKRFHGTVRWCLHMFEGERMAGIECPSNGMSLACRPSRWRIVLYRCSTRDVYTHRFPVTS